MPRRTNLLLLCVVALIFGGRLTAHADEKADALLQQVAQTALAARTLTADVTGSQTQQLPDGTTTGFTLQGTIKLKRPNLARVDLVRDPAIQTVAADGHTLFVVMPPHVQFDPKSHQPQMQPKTQYTKQPVDPQGRNISAGWIFQVALFFTGKLDALDATAKPTRRYAGKEMVEGTDYDVIEETADKPWPYTRKLYIDANMPLLRSDLTFKLGTQEMRQIVALKNVIMDQPLTDADFAYTPPQDAIPYQPPTAQDNAQARMQVEENLRAVGTTAPAFTLATPTGGKVTLKQLLHGNKAVLVNFWFYGCHPCQEEFPLLSRLYEEFKAKGFGMVAINNGDNRQIISGWASKNSSRFPTAMAGKGPLSIAFPVIKDYGVQVYPTNYLIGSDGKVLWRGAGIINESEIRTALKRAGIE